MEQPIAHQEEQLLERLFKLEEELSEKKLYIFQPEKGPAESLTVKELVHQVKLLGSRLQQELAPQEKVLLLFPQGLSYISAMLACWYANVIAIPAPFVEMAEPGQSLAKIRTILLDSDATCILTERDLQEFLATQPGLPAIPIWDIWGLSFDDADMGEARTRSGTDLAMLLYTSGSTAQPKGVMHSHSNLLVQAVIGSIGREIKQESCLVSWMPQFHSFGICFNLLSPLLTGATCILMAPGCFIKHPDIWIKTLDHYQATHTAGPNFAFDYCCSTLDIVELKGYSLQSLQAIVSGGEPFRKETHENFIQKFRALGLKDHVFCMDYGSSETGPIVLSRPNQPLRFLSLDRAFLSERKVKRTKQRKQGKSIVSSGEASEQVKIVCVNPETAIPCSNGEVGEIWVKSPGVAVGYYQRPEETAKAFGGTLSSTQEGGFFRTGDLGFIENNQVYIVGREKEVIIINGKNHHPVDLEWTIKKELPGLTLPLAVFSCEIDQQEKVVVVQEVDSTVPEMYQSLIREIRSAISKTHGIEIYEIRLVPPGSIPKTGSGKVLRKQCRNLYLEQALPVLFQEKQASAPFKSRVEVSPTGGGILEILRKQVLLPLLKLDLTQLDEVSTLSELGLNSLQYVQIAKGIETVFAIEFAPVMLFKYSSFSALTEFLTEHTSAPSSSVVATVTPEILPEEGSVNPAPVADEGIAIIGVHLNYPGEATDLNRFWENLVQSKDCITAIAQSRPLLLDAAPNSAPSFPHWGGFIEDVDAFDAPFFGISPLEAQSMDPQQRKVLELIWSVIEDSGYNPNHFAGQNIGLFVGAHNIDYAQLVAQQPELIETYGAYLDSGLHMSLIAHRVSRWFDFRGPSEVVNTACSSSLVAIHHAVESIYRGESTLAIAAGVNLLLSAQVYRAGAKAGMLSPDGRCKTFDERADGFVRGEGYGAILLKPYRQALADHDPVYGVIRGAVVNHDGHSNSLRAPNLNAQKELIQTAYQKSGLPLETIGYIETHGTGTALGDPIEIQALQDAFRAINPTLPQGYCGLGTAKTNIGHCESAAGIAGLLKILASMKMATLPGILHFQQLNPYISLQNSPFFIVTHSQEWKRYRDAAGNELPRRAGVSSFGFGGANAHVIVEEHLASPVGLVESKPRPELIPLSAKTPESLRAYVQQLHTFLSRVVDAEPNQRRAFSTLNLANLAYTLQVGRAEMEERVAFLVRDIPELLQKLTTLIQNGDPEDCWQGRVKQSKNNLSLLGDDEDSRELALKWLAKRKLEKIGPYWAQGGTIDWNCLVGATKPRRLNLPTYCFAKHRYWIPKQKAVPQNRTTVGCVIHPLLQQNVSDFLEQRFCSKFTGQEFFLKDHVVSRRAENPDQLQVDIDGYDAQGKAWVRLKGLSLQPWEKEQATFPDSPAYETLLLRPEWRKQELDLNCSASADETALVILCEPTGVSGIEYDSYIDEAECLVLIAEEGESLSQRFERYTIGTFEAIKRLFIARPKGRLLAQIVGFSVTKPTLLSGLAGLLRTAQLENPKLTAQLIEVAEATDPVQIKEILQANRHRPQERWIRYQAGQRYVASWRKLEPVEPVFQLPWKAQGVYLITGGAGGLGSIFAREIARQVERPTLILTGRSELNANQQARLKELEALGALVDYRQVDVTQPEAVAQLLQAIQAKYGLLNGILHSAGINKDNFILKKTSLEFREVLAPKVAGVVNLDQASRDLPLDLMVFFSSVAGSIGNIGQVDYAVANAFMDAYATERNQLVAAGERSGQTLSINWPLWEEGGMRMDAANQKKIWESAGMVAMPTAAGLRAFYQAVVSGQEQVMVLQGDPVRIEGYLFGEPSQAAVASSAAVAITLEPGLLREKTLQQLKALFGEITKLSVGEIDAGEPMESYGLDSILVTQLNQRLEGIFSELSKTLFYEYQTLGALADYLVVDYPDACQAWAGFPAFERSDPAVSTVPLLRKPILEERLPRKMFPKLKRDFAGRAALADSADPIAIIGLSGRYPQAPTLKDYWENLKNGRDCICEIPAERWPLEGFYHSDPQEAIVQGKSYSKWGGFVEGFADFDPLFFNIAPREASNMDPQERLFLEACWEVFEDAGYTQEELERQNNRRIGVFVGITKTGFELYGPDLWKQGEAVQLRTSFGSVANRISYLLNLKGPSMPIDTMCSASLTAIHEACEHIYRGECEMALAGGVNLYLHPANYIALCHNHMLAADGKCKSFGRGGNGFVPGEGVGVVLLKRCSRAIADGDHIYAVIRGTGINHGGKTNGYTVPNPVAQGEVIRAALDQAGVNARAVSYIEAHGTGTELGDPIEITGLHQAFKKDTPDTGFCALGSVKSNIGHLEAAAGIAGVTKIVLQMQHRQLVPSLHAAELNPNIPFAKTPFVLQQELAEWKRPVVENGGEVREYPRIAGISSFGAGGANAHIVLEEFRPLQPELPSSARSPQEPALIVLSARSESGLRRRAQQLLAALTETGFTDQDLGAIAYTLQVGREAMEERLALVAASLQALVEKLQGFCSGQTGSADLYRGQVQPNKGTFVALAADPEMQETLEKWIQRRKYANLLDLWVKGLVFDWNKLYGESQPDRVSLPTYPFARERYWLPELQVQSAASSAVASPVKLAYLHPLLQQNTSNLFRQRFTSCFTGREFFLADHRVKGRPVLPGVAYLEMARAAAAQAMDVADAALTGIQLKQVVWIRPIVVNEAGLQVHIGLAPQANGELAFEIYSSSFTAGGEIIIHSQGSAVLQEASEAPRLDLQALQAQCTLPPLLPDECYEAFKQMGIDYGPAQRGIERIYVGPAQVLAQLSLPGTVAHTLEQFVLHPSLLDAAFQASIGLQFNSDGSAPRKPVLPYALQALEVFGPCSANMWALIRYSDANAASDKVRRLDIDLCDAQGKVKVRLMGLASRSLEGAVGSPREASGEGTLFLAPSWQAQSIAPESSAPDYHHHHVLLCELHSISQESVAGQIGPAQCHSLQANSPDLATMFQDYARQVLEAVQSLLKEKPAGRVLLQLVLPNQPEQQCLAGLAGLLKTAHLENPHFFGQVIEIEKDETEAGLSAKLLANRLTPLDQRIRYQDGKRWRAVLTETEELREAVTVPWKERGVYLITGGGGGLGMIFANEIAQQVSTATVILTGRAPLNAERQAALDRLRKLDVRVEYRQVDVSQAEAVAALIAGIQADFGGINGIIHSAGVIRDSFILKKTPEELEAVLAPKVAGLVLLDQACRELPLDFFVLFASGAGVVGNAGQADYAAANAFMDAFAQYRNLLVHTKQRQGFTLAIDWPLWQEGGMRVDAATETRMRENTGMAALRTATGIQAFYQSIALGRDQVMVLEGNVAKLRSWFVGSSEPLATLNVPEIRGEAQGSLSVETLNWVKRIFAKELKLAPERIQNDTPFEKYGVDSIVQMNLIAELEQITGELSKTLLFEYSSVSELVDYLVKQHANRLESALNSVRDEGKQPEKKAIQPLVSQNPPSVLGDRQRFALLPQTVPSTTQSAPPETNAPIAIIGISGRYPLSDSLEELWAHLLAGDNCITEAPPERWQVSLTKTLTGAAGEQAEAKIYGGFLKQINRFDHHLFEVPQAQVMELSPELRLFLEIVWETFEDAGYTKTLLQERQSTARCGVGVFVGTMYNQYPWTIPSLEQAVQCSNVTDWQIANRTSHFFNLTGPSIAVNTACSSSLTAIHLACESLKQGSCSMAIAGGINLTLEVSKYSGLQQIKFLGSGKQSKSFGVGDGYIPGEGVGAVLLKPLAQAIQDGDRVYAVIKSSFVNHSGGRQIYTAPEPKQQAQLIGESIRRSGIDPATIGYVESAANGSDLGDPIELIALNNAFKQYTAKQQFVALGSVKSNLGHLEAASGISQLSKVVLQLKYQTLAPTINARPVNPNIKLEQTAFYLQEETAPWTRITDDKTGEPLPRRSMINSFGAGGAYANLIVEEYVGANPAITVERLVAAEYPLLFSAKSRWSLQQYLQRMREFLEQNPAVELAALAHTLQKRNPNLEHKAAIIARSVPDFAAKLTVLQQFGANFGEQDVYFGVGNEAASSFVAQDDFEKRDLRQSAALWVAGAPVDWERLGEEFPTLAVDLPKYAFEHQIQFDFKHQLIKDATGETEQFSDWFYRILIEKIAKGECSEAEFKEALS